MVKGWLVLIILIEGLDVNGSFLEAVVRGSRVFVSGVPGADIDCFTYD
jgi:hypothetical protein